MKCIYVEWFTKASSQEVDLSWIMKLQASDLKTLSMSEGYVDIREEGRILGKALREAFKRKHKTMSISTNTQ